MPRPRKPASPFRYFNSSPEVVRLVVLMYVCFPLSLRNVKDLLFERGIDISHETVRLWWNRFGPMFAADVRRQRVSRMRGFRQWKWHLDEVYVKINGEMHYLWRAVDQEGEMLESYVTNPEVFDMDRPELSKQIGFAFGVHICIGRKLAEMEAERMFQEIVARLPDYELAKEPEIVPTFTRGYSSLMLRRKR